MWGKCESEIVVIFKRVGMIILIIDSSADYFPNSLIIREQKVPI